MLNQKHGIVRSCNWELLVETVVFSPSDLDADFEDNQDYDSTVSQSETKLPMFIPSSRVDSVQEVESPTSADSMSAAMTAAVSDATELQRVTLTICVMIAVTAVMITVKIIIVYSDHNCFSV